MTPAAGLLSQVGDAACSASKHVAVGLAGSLYTTHGDGVIKNSVIWPSYIVTPMLGYDEAEGDENSCHTTTIWCHNFPCWHYRHAKKIGVPCSLYAVPGYMKN